MIQIQEIVLYSHDGKKRVIPFRTGSVNIITGKSATGKSTIIQIIDYCLGASRCDVPEGIIREKVSWFGLLLDIKGSKIFIARENPPSGSFTTNRAHFLEGNGTESPAQVPKSNTTIEAIEEVLSQKIGIHENLHVPPEGQTRRPTTANIRHGLFYCFQDQDVIASKSLLFHKQSEPFVPQSMKDTLPYLLGAVNEDHLSNLHELTKAKRHLAGLQKELQEYESVKGTSIGKAYALVAEAKTLGLLPDIEDPQSMDEVYISLKKAASWQPESLPEKDDGKDFLSLQDEIYELENQIHHLAEKIGTAKHFASGASGFQGEAEEQVLRLKSIGLFQKKSRLENCPVCNNKSNNSEIEQEIHSSIFRLHKELDTVTKEQPKIVEFVDRLEKQKEGVVSKFRKKQKELEGVLAGQAAFRNFRDRSMRIGMTLGRVSLWLDSVSISSDDTHLKKQIEKWKKDVTRLEKLVDAKEVEEVLVSITNRISDRMTKESEKLALEHHGNPVRFDIKDLTVVIDLEDKPVPLKRIGSGENHVGYHLIALTALQDHFVKNKRPVPRFLVLDQPSQVYYPPEKQDKEGSLKNIKDEDKIALSRMYKFIFDFAKSQKGNFQVILLDHAKPDDPEFVSYIVEEWRGDKALIPLDW